MSIEGIPTAKAGQKKNGISAVWVIPIVAALIGSWLVFKSALEEKTLIEVTFKSAAGIEAGKTIVKLHNIKIGSVKEVKFAEDLSKIIVVMEFEGIKASRFTESTRFWVVKPRIGIGGVSGLDTLLSGAYIEIDPGESGLPIKKFVGLEEPGNFQLGNPGTTYFLKTDKLGSLSRGSPIKYRNIEVGFVTRYSLSKNSDFVDVEIFVRSPFDKLVEDKTRFWDVSGLDVDVGAEGLKVNLDSISSLMSGGVSFFTSDNPTGVQAKESTVFKLHSTEHEEFEETKVFSVPMRLYFDNGVEGLDVGAPVEYKGLRFGTVSDISVEADRKTDDLLTFATINIEPDRFPIIGGSEHKDDSQRTKLAHRFFEKMAKRGMRAQLKSGNLLTGKSLVSLSMFPDAKKESLYYVDKLAVFPTMPESLSGIMQDVNQAINRLESLPLEEIGTNIQKMTESINSLVVSLNASEGGVIGEQAKETMEEISKAARSIRGVAEYLERHPEALIKGKTEE